MTSPAAGSTLSGSSATFNWGGNGQCDGMAAAGGKQRGRLQLPGQRPAGQHRHQPDGERPADGRQHRICAAALPDRGRLVLPGLHLQGVQRGRWLDAGDGQPGEQQHAGGEQRHVQLVGWRHVGDGVVAVCGQHVGRYTVPDTGNLGASVTSRTVSGLPTDGSTVYVQLWYLSGSWKSLSYTYKAYDANAVVLTDPFLLQCFGGTIPSNSELRALTTFSCDGVDLSSASLAQLGNLPNLRELDLSHTKLADISGRPA
ncbi:MAG: hypothetical protein HZT40_02470 [Candidatus Thiothrix singaporensis]|uniref:Leucine-rich repeat domain-containing protein n=1 Tax=Candidatus Thiothrix singaporensis TaxID=2799669 RepID=A0A7L6ANK5_9GAMM|nr:MAG: hypothetical protein HZT40_02470 [Candidatus Thiothrix singaporensis]